MEKLHIGNEKSANKVVEFLRTMAIGTYLNSEVMKNLLGDEHYERFNKMLKNARKKANYYVSEDN